MALSWVEFSAASIHAQTAPVAAAVATVQSGAPATDEGMSTEVTINIDDGPIAQVLNAFSRQTGRSIVLGPEVTGKVTARLHGVKWQDALDAILRPYGFGYYQVGDAIIVSSVEKLPKTVAATVVSSGGVVAATSAALVAPPDKVVKVFVLKYLDAADVEDVVKGYLSQGGTIGRLVAKSQSWEDVGQQGGTSTSSENLGRLRRFSEKDDQTRGKTLVVVDTQAKIDQIAAVLAQLDTMPMQVQIEAKFVEVRANLLRDIGFEWGSGENGTVPGVKTVATTAGGKLYGAGAQQVSGSVKPAAFAPQTTALGGVLPLNGGMTLAFQKLSDFQFEALLHMLEEDASYNLLSSPRILAMNNQDAVIIVGQKLPIIKQDVSTASGGAPTVSTSLERYEDEGIKLKVLPQICDNEFINLIVHPSVRNLVGYQSGKAVSGAAQQSLTDYPVLATREAETQVMLKSGQTIVIGGMMKENKQTTQIKVPVLGSIPLLGVLFRRDTVSTEKTELLVFLTATIRNPADEKGVDAKAK
jgi:type IV pilus secretin PilQ/predicted competence protein